VHSIPSERQLTRSEHSQSIRLIARVSTLIHGWVAHSAGEEPLPEKPISHRQETFLQIERQTFRRTGKSACWIRFHLVRRSRIQCFHFRSARDRFDAGRHLRCRHPGLRDTESPLHGGANEESMKMLEEIGRRRPGRSLAERKAGYQEKIMDLAIACTKKATRVCADA